MSDALVEQDGHKLIVTMNRPERRNALSSEMLRIMEGAWDRVNEDPEIHGIIVQMPLPKRIPLSVVLETLGEPIREYFSKEKGERLVKRFRVSDALLTRVFLVKADQQFVGAVVVLLEPLAKLLRRSEKRR